MRVAFLGTGSAFSLERYNGAVAVDGRLLLDAGAPLLPHLHRLGIDPGAIEAVFLSHFHGDHVLGLPPFLLYRAFRPSGPLTVIGPPGVEDRVEALQRMAWGDAWSQHRRGLDVLYRDAAPRGEAAGVPYESVKMDHGDMDCRGYRLHLDGRMLAYAGDTIASAALDDLVQGADVVITEASGPEPSPVHTSWAEVEALRERHPGTRFLFNHLYAGSTPGAVEDLEVVET